MPAAEMAPVSAMPEPRCEMERMAGTGKLSGGGGEGEVRGMKSFGSGWLMADPPSPKAVRHARTMAEEIAALKPLSDKELQQVRGAGERRICLQTLDFCSSALRPRSPRGSACRWTLSTASATSAGEAGILMGKFWKYLSHSCRHTAFPSSTLLPAASPRPPTPP